MAGADAGSAHAFSDPFRGARWGVSHEFTAGYTGGVDQQLRYTFSPEGSMTDGFTATIRILQEMTSKYSTHPEVVQFTRRLFNARKVRNHDELGEIFSLVNYFQGTFTTSTPDDQIGTPLLKGDKGSYRYQKDPYGAELFQAPTKVLRDIQAGESGADCDDIAACAAACLAAAGYPAMLLIVDADAGNPGAYNHVMLSSKTSQPNEMFGDEWFPIELIHPFRPGHSVRITQYIPLIVEPWDVNRREQGLIPSRFR
jgi:hypothetical protein